MVAQAARPKPLLALKAWRNTSQSRHEMGRGYESKPPQQLDDATVRVHEIALPKTMIWQTSLDHAPDLFDSAALDM